MFDFYPTCLEKTKHVGIFTPRCYFPHMFGFWHICMGKGTHVWKKPHNYMFENVCHFPHMCGKSHWHAYFPLSYLWIVLVSVQVFYITEEWILTESFILILNIEYYIVNIEYWIVNSEYSSDRNAASAISDIYPHHRYHLFYLTMLIISLK